MFFFGFITEAAITLIVKLVIKKSEIYSLKGIGNLIFILLMKDLIFHPLFIIFSPSYWYS